VLTFGARRTIALGKFGAFPANLILDRPYNLTYEIQEKLPDETFCRLRIVSVDELYEDVFAEEAAVSDDSAAPAAANGEDAPVGATLEDGTDYTLADTEIDTIIAQTSSASQKQLLTQSEIEILKKEGAGAGKDLIAKLMLSHTALDQKTAFSLAKYKLVKMKKFIRRFTVLPLDVANFASWQLDQRDAGKILDLRAEMIGLVGCLANVHCGKADIFFPVNARIQPESDGDGLNGATAFPLEEEARWYGGRFLVVDDTGGLLPAILADRMGLLAPTPPENPPAGDANTESERAEPNSRYSVESYDAEETADGDHRPPQPGRSQEYRDDFHIPYSRNNTITLLCAAQEPNLSFLKYFGYDNTAPNASNHSLAAHILNLSWLQLVSPEQDFTYATPPPVASEEVLASWKPGHRGNYHRKRRRWARTRYTVNDTRRGEFSALVTASTLDPISILQHTLPLLAGGATIAIYSPTLESLAKLADCFSVQRRAAWMGAGRPPAAVGKSVEELERWEGTEDFPLNPTLLLGATIQTSRVRQWQVLPGRTHPLMSAKGGSEGYVFSAWRAKPAEGKVEARGKFTAKKPKKDRHMDSEPASEMSLD
jgi:tRNA (adenine58-N1)-methyltransferase non-catalytic subunit